MSTRRDLSIAEMEVLAELATAVPDLVAVKDQLLAALAGAAAPGAQGGGLQPGGWKELMEAVRLGVLNPGQARKFVAIPQGEPRMLVRLARLRTQRGGPG